ncbi:MAG: hypothetical protein P9L97_09170 [Candidatus Tenebribacter davisii]|nr:hypothetical protein [Candidatus Tenebribacter davisii]
MDKEKFSRINKIRTGGYMTYEIETKIRELVHQAATWQNNLVHTLVELKVVYGAIGAKRYIAEELAKYGIGSLPKGTYLMRLVTVAEKLAKLQIPRDITDRLPFPSWMVLIKYVTNENAQEMVDYLHHQDGQLKILEAKLKQGYKLRYNLFTAEHEFTKKSEINEDSES